MAGGIFDLRDDPDALVRAAERWAELGRTLGSAGDDVTEGSQTTFNAGWEGQTATSFDEHRRELTADFDAAAEAASTVNRTLTQSAGALRVAQAQLDTEFSKVADVRHVDFLNLLQFFPEDEDEERRVNQAIAAAEGIRTDLDAKLTADADALTAATAVWDDISSSWASVAGGNKPFDYDDDAGGAGVITNGDQTIVNTGPGDDEVIVFVNGKGEQIVIVNGVPYRFPPGQHVTVRTGQGEDVVRVGKGGTVGFTITGSDDEDHITGGDGDDTILGLGGDDQIDGGGGDDQLSGNAGRDYLDGQDGDDVVTGGDGDDTVYGLGGDDVLSGGDGQDYLEGGTGDDVLDGGDDGDVLSGGDDDDTIIGGDGDDVSYAGRGDDTTYGGTGADTSNAESGDRDEGVENHVQVEIEEPPEYIKIEGSPEFVARVEADLQLLMSSPRGQEMLANLERAYDDSGTLGIGKQGLTISEFDGNDNSSAHPGGPLGQDHEIKYSPYVDTIQGAPPSVVLYHELAHVYDYANDTYMDGQYNGDDPRDHGDNNSERQASGLPVDHDNDPSTPEIIDPDHPVEYTENGLRDEMGLPPRTHY
ncbi:hypothetical protein GCM10023340_07810 [Nocardioides marinquilinus]|uniref:Calcium-binding protein n=1 Tax=Nocardioides marinquilinus TaxID=1210400 RepID=A0ABP9P9Q4_9ACTN